MKCLQVTQPSKPESQRKNYQSAALILSFLSLSLNEKEVKVVITPQYSLSLLCYLTVEYLV